MKRTVRLTERELRNMISESVRRVINEMSPEKMARAFVAAHVDNDELNSSDEQTAFNKNGQKVHRNTQKDRRKRQIDAFKKGLQNKLSQETGRNVEIGRDKHGNDVSYSGEVGGTPFIDGRFASGNPDYRHVANVDGYKPIDSYKTDRTIKHGDMKAADRVGNMVDAMAGFHDELTGGKGYNERMKYLNDRANDVEANNKYQQDMQDYQQRKKAHEEEMNTYNRKPWYKKLGNKKPQPFNAEKPKSPDLKTGPYFLPRDTEDIYKEVERTKQNRENNKQAYNKILKRK